MRDRTTFASVCSSHNFSSRSFEISLGLRGQIKVQMPPYVTNKSINIRDNGHLFRQLVYNTRGNNGTRYNHDTFRKVICCIFILRFDRHRYHRKWNMYRFLQQNKKLSRRFGGDTILTQKIIPLNFARSITAGNQTVQLGKGNQTPPRQRATHFKQINYRLGTSASAHRC